MEDILPTSISRVDLIAFVWAGAAFVVILLLGLAFSPRNAMASRLKSLQERREGLKAGSDAPRRQSTKEQAKVDMTQAMREVLKRFSALQDEQSQNISKKLMQAGIRTKDSVIIFRFAQIVLPIAFASLLAIGFNLFDLMADRSPMTRAIVTVGLIIGGYMAPDFYVKNETNKRVDAIRKGLPDGLDLLVICAEAGLTVDAAFNRVARELGNGFPELGDEFTLVSVELGFLTDRRQAFDNLASRVPLEAMRGVVTTMIQTEKYGTPLASALRVLSAEFRNERMMRAEEKAAGLPAIMTVPLILFILPVLFVAILGPAACKLADNFSGAQ